MLTPSTILRYQWKRNWQITALKGKGRCLLQFVRGYKVDYAAIYPRSSSNTDLFGNAISSTESEGVIQNIKTFQDQFTSYGKKVTAIYAAAKEDKECVAANSIAASIDFFIGDRKSKERGRMHLSNALNSSRTVSEWENLWLSIGQSYSNGAIDQAIEKHFIMAEKFPSDLASAFLCQIYCFYNGDLRRHLNIYTNIFDHHKENSNIYPGIAFAYNELDDRSNALKFGIKAEEMDPLNPWLHHFFAHYNINEPEKSIEYLRNKVEIWPDYIKWVGGHNIWHLCVALYEKSDFDSICDLLRDKLWVNDVKFKSDRNIQVDTIALLWRFDLLAEIDECFASTYSQLEIIQSAWRDLFLIAEQKAKEDEQTIPFMDIHLFYALAKFDILAATNYLNNYRAVYRLPVDNNSSSSLPSWYSPRSFVVLNNFFDPLAESIIDFHQRKFELAASKLTSIPDSTFLPLGGSKPQRALFQTYSQFLQTTIPPHDTNNSLGGIY